MLGVLIIWLFPGCLLIRVLILCLQRKRLLIALLFLEIVLLSRIVGVSIMGLTDGRRFFCLVLLRFGVCEARVGLSLLVRMARFCGSDMLKMLRINKC
jgi:NADH:ubiquinone oxidoreductase subunit K